MLWQVRALIEDRPGSLADLAVACGDRAVNILGLQIFPAPDGRVVDELVLHTPGGWDADDLVRMCAVAGVPGATVVPCPPQVLEDQAVRYLRAAQVVGERPGLLEDQLARLLDADVAADPGEAGTLLLDDPAGPPVALSREVPFSDTEVARAGELRRVAAAALGLVVATPDPEAGEAPEGLAPVLRAGDAADARAVLAMHARCSAETVRRRYHAPVPQLSARLARAVLAPPGGTSLVLTMGYDVVALGTLAPDPSEEGERVAEVGLVVEDRWQRRGLGSRLLRALAVEAADRGFATLTCHVLPDNEAVVPTVRRSGLRVRAVFDDGLTQYRIPVGPLASRDGAPSRRGNRPAMGEVTTGLAALLNVRRELREIHPAADLIDQAVRGGA